MHSRNVKCQSSAARPAQAAICTLQSQPTNLYVLLLLPLHPTPACNPFLPCQITGIITQSPPLGDPKHSALLSITNVTFVDYTGGQFFALEGCGEPQSAHDALSITQLAIMMRTYVLDWDCCWLRVRAVVSAKPSAWKAVPPCWAAFPNPHVPQLAYAAAVSPCSTTVSLRDWFKVNPNPPPACRPPFLLLYACAGKCKTFQGGATSFMKQLRFVQSNAGSYPALSSWSYGHQAVYLDTDGSLINSQNLPPELMSALPWSLATPGGTWHSAVESELFDPAECVYVRGKGTSNDGAICSPDLVFRWERQCCACARWLTDTRSLSHSHRVQLRLIP